MPADSADPYRPDPITVRVPWKERFEVAQDALAPPTEHPYCPGYFVAGLSIVMDGDPSSPVAAVTFDYARSPFEDTATEPPQ